MTRYLPCSALLLLLAVHGSALKAQPVADENPLYQVYLGALDLDNQSTSWPGLSDGEANADFATLPIVGLENEFAFHRGWVHWGLNSGGSVAYKDGGIRFTGTRGSQSTSLDGSLLLAEIHLGGYVRGRLNPRITTYAAAGPMLMYGRHEIDDLTVRDAGGNLVEDATGIDGGDSSAINLGYYARAGIDFEIRQDQHLGFGFRYLASDLDLDDTAGNLDIEGPQFVFTFSTRM